MKSAAESGKEADKDEKDADRGKTIARATITGVEKTAEDEAGRIARNEQDSAGMTIILCLMNQSHSKGALPYRSRNPRSMASGFVSLSCGPWPNQGTAI